MQKSKVQNFIILFIALIAGAAAIFLVKTYIEDEITAYKQSIDEKYKPVNVVVANRQLRRGEVLNNSMLAIRPVPSGFVHADAIRPNEVDVALGHKLVYALNAGEPLLSSHVALNKGDTFSNLVEEGKRAITFPVDVLSSMSGMLTPGDIIDLLVTMSDNSEEKTFTLLSNVTIIATGNQVSEIIAKDEDGPRSGRFQTITLHVSPQEAGMIAHANAEGEMTVLLRSRTDEKDLKLEAITNNTILGKKYVDPGPRIIRAGQN